MSSSRDAVISPLPSYLLLLPCCSVRYPQWDLQRCTANRSANCYTCGVKFRVTIESDEDGVFVAECPALPGCIFQGKTRDEAMANIRDAIQDFVESLKKHGEPIPAPITEAVVEVSV